MLWKTLTCLTLVSLLPLSKSSGDSTPPPARSAAEGLNSGPDLIAGDVADLNIFGTAGTQHGLAAGITTCNAGDAFVGFFSIPNTDHPVVAENLYRMSGGADNSDRFEQVGQSWVKHTFGATQSNSCNFGCLPGGDVTHLGGGCSDTYFASQSASQNLLGSRAWVNPFTGVFPSTSRNHTGHVHTAVSHMMVVEDADLNPAMNPGANYYAELLYVTPDEYAWCQTHPGECNMYNNASYLRYQIHVSGTTYLFDDIGASVRMAAAINAWTGATIQTIEPEPGVDGRAFLAYKVSGPVAGVYHYEYAIYNQNLDRAIQSFSVPRLLVPGIGETGDTVQNVGFHAPPQHPGFPNDGTQGDAGFSSAEWTFNAGAMSLTWNSETFAQNQNANAIRWGTLYNFRFDSTTPPATSNATIGFYKTGTPITVPIQGPAPVGGPTATPIPVTTHFEVIAPSKVGTFQFFDFTVRALDQFNNTVTIYPGTVHFTSTSQPAQLPADSTLVSGFSKFNADLKSPGTYTITATDTGNPSITGTSNDISVVSDIPPTPTPTPTPVCTPLPPTTQGFEDVSILVSNGWYMQNNSQPGPGPIGWFQGNSDVFAAQSGPASSYIGASFANGTSTSTLSNWLLTPPVPLRNGVVMTFWTRTVTTPFFPDRLQVRMSSNGASTNVGATATGVGDFAALLLDINPTYSTTGYPTEWTQFTATVTGLPVDATGRLAFRYFVENGGPSGINSDYIGIDNVQIYFGCQGFIIPTPTPGPPAPTLSPAPTPRGGPTPFPEPAVQFEVDGPATANVNVPIGFLVIAQDKFGNTDPKYAGTVHFTSSDPTADLPPDSGLTSGTGTFSATFHTAGSRTITARDSQFSFIVGTSNTINVTGPTPTPAPTATPSPTPPIVTPTPTPTSTPTPAPVNHPLNLSTRLRVQPGDQVGIGGFILTGTGGKRLLLRGIGPSLQPGVTDALANPTLDLRDSNGVRILANDNWRDTQEAEILATGVPPANNLEAAILDTLDPGIYTVILGSADASTGVGLVEIYDIDQTATPILANLSTRAFVGMGGDAVISGFILGGPSNQRVIVRGLGPSLTPSGVANALADPTLELRDSNGALLMMNNNWQDDPDQAALLNAAGLAPTNNLESGLAATLPFGPYTVILAGSSSGTGVGLVEVYDLGP